MKFEPVPPSPLRRQTSREWPIFVVPAVLALVGYVLFYGCDARLRTGRGPWEVTFLAEADGTPALRLQQASLGLSNIVVRFPGERISGEKPPLLPAVVRFDAPQKVVPFGTLKFEDFMYLPGTLVLHCFEHEVQLLPRALFLDRQEKPWRSDSTFNLDMETKPPSLEAPRIWRRGNSNTPAKPRTSD